MTAMMPSIYCLDHFRISVQLLRGRALESSSAETWAPLNGSDLAMKVYGCNFEPEGMIRFQPITGAQLSDINLDEYSAIPQGTSLDWEYSADSGVASTETILRLFVFGTLKRYYWNHQRFCAQARGIDPAVVWGRLYYLHAGFTALEVPDGLIPALARGTAAPWPTPAGSRRSARHASAARPVIGT